MSAFTLPETQMAPQQELKQCPCCNGTAALNPSAGRSLFYAECTECGLQTLPGVAIAVTNCWNARRGTVSAFGGRATKGLRSKRKFWSSKRNLRKARQAKALKRLRPRIQQTVQELSRLRQAEARVRKCSGGPSADPLAILFEQAVPESNRPVPCPDLPAEQPAELAMTIPQ